MFTVHRLAWSLPDTGGSQDASATATGYFHLALLSSPNLGPLTDQLGRVLEVQVTADAMARILDRSPGRHGGGPTTGVLAVNDAVVVEPGESAAGRGGLEAATAAGAARDGRDSTVDWSTPALQRPNTIDHELDSKVERPKSERWRSRCCGAASVGIVPSGSCRLSDEQVRAQHGLH